MFFTVKIAAWRFIRKGRPHKSPILILCFSQPAFDISFLQITPVTDLKPCIRAKYDNSLVSSQSNYSVSILCVDGQIWPFPDCADASQIGHVGLAYIRAHNVIRFTTSRRIAVTSTLIRSLFPPGEACQATATTANRRKLFFAVASRMAETRHTTVVAYCWSWGGDWKRGRLPWKTWRRNARFIYRPTSLFTIKAIALYNEYKINKNLTN